MDYNWFEKEWPVITGAPILVAAAVLSIALLIWFLVNWGYRREIGGLKAQRDFFKDRAQTAEQKLKNPLILNWAKE